MIFITFLIGRNMLGIFYKEILPGFFFVRTGHLTSIELKISSFSCGASKELLFMGWIKF